jgi:hypothetical protein
MAIKSFMIQDPGLIIKLCLFVIGDAEKANVCASEFFSRV